MYMVEAPNKMFTCDICDKSFEIDFVLFDHRQTHANEVYVKNDIKEELFEEKFSTDQIGNSEESLTHNVREKTWEENLEFVKIESKDDDETIIQAKEENNSDTESEIRKGTINIENKVEEPLFISINANNTEEYIKKEIEKETVEGDFLSFQSEAENIDATVKQEIKEEIVLKLDKRKVNQSTKGICDICHKIFRNKNDFENHKLTHFGINPYTCDICHKEFRNKYNFRDHMLIHNGNLFQCDMCGKKFTSTHKLNDHKVMHIDEKAFACEFCGKTFARSHEINVHKRIHTGEKPYSCDKCHKTFAQLGMLKAHKRTHTGERPFKCNICEKGFTQINGLTRHKLVHTGERPFPCSLCERAFTKKKALDVHLVSHNKPQKPQKTFFCNICNKDLGGLAKLKRHEKTSIHLKKLAQANKSLS